MSNQSENLLLEYLKRLLEEYWSDDKPWKLCTLSNYGRGLFATRDILANEVIFYDLPLLIGPIGNPNEPVICVACYKILEPIELCAEKCGLPLCSECPNKKTHRLECELFRKWQPRQSNEISFTKVKFLTAIRSFFLSADGERLFKQLQQNNLTEDLNNFINEFDNFPRNEDSQVLDKLKEAVAILNTNTFKTFISSEYNRNICVKGTYPLACLMNHSCTPNTRHDINQDFLKTVTATRKISKGEQIFTTYSQILWNTNTRRMHLALTKQFWCACDRCADPTENGTFLSGLRCLKKTCKGLITPLDPLNLSVSWQCNKCKHIVEYQQILTMQDVFGSMIKNFFISQHSAEEVIHFIENRLSIVMPISNQFVVEAQWNAIEFLGHIRRQGDTNLDRLKGAESFCLNILEILEKLKVGLCTAKGLLCYELYKSRQKIRELNGQCSEASISFEGCGLEKQDLDHYLYQTMSVILKDNVAAPTDLLKS